VVDPSWWCYLTDLSEVFCCRCRCPLCHFHSEFSLENEVIKTFLRIVWENSAPMLQPLLDHVTVLQLGDLGEPVGEFCTNIVAIARSCDFVSRGFINLGETVGEFCTNVAAIARSCDCFNWGFGRTCGKVLHQCCSHCQIMSCDCVFFVFFVEQTRGLWENSALVVALYVSCGKVPRFHCGSSCCLCRVWAGAHIAYIVIVVSRTHMQISLLYRKKQCGSSSGGKCIC